MCKENNITEKAEESGAQMKQPSVHGLVWSIGSVPA